MTSTLEHRVLAMATCRALAACLGDGHLAGQVLVGRVVLATALYLVDEQLDSKTFRDLLTRATESARLFREEDDGA